MAEQMSLFDLEDELPKGKRKRRASDPPQREQIMAEEVPTEAKTPAPKKVKAKGKKKAAPAAPTKERRKRTPRPYPVVSFKEAAALADAIFKIGSGEKVRRLTLLEKLKRNPTSSSTLMLITNSGKYGITKGSYSADYLELTEQGHKACNPANSQRTRLQAQSKLAIEHILPFKVLYDAYVNKKLPAHEVMKDKLVESAINVDNPTECIDLFVVNVKDLGLLRTIAGAETLVSIEQTLEETPATPADQSSAATLGSSSTVSDAGDKTSGSPKWDTICFYVAPIGEPGSEPRKHSDLFLSSLVEPALKELGLTVIRADGIAEPGMITTAIIEHLKKAKLVIVDLSLLNPNVFYEMAIRHAAKGPIVQMIRKGDRLPFDVNQVNTLVIDNTDIYTFTPKLETYRSEITTYARRAIEDPEHFGNPISVFYPNFWK